MDIIWLKGLGSGGSEEMLLDVIIGVRKSKEDEGGKLPVFVLEVVKGTVRMWLLESIKLLLEDTIVDEFGLCETSIIDNGGDTVFLLKFVFEVGP